MSQFLERTARNARRNAESKYARNMPARAQLIDAFVMAAVNVARVEERERLEQEKARRVVAKIIANTEPSRPIKQQCMVVRKGPALPSIRRVFTPAASRIVRTFVIPDSVEGVPEDLRIAA